MIREVSEIFYGVYSSAQTKLYCSFAYPKGPHIQLALFVFGVALVLAGIGQDAISQTTYNDERIRNSVNALLTYIEGSFGALVMVCAGVGAIMSSAFGQYRASLGLLVVSVGAFILRSFISTFFNEEGLQP